MKASRSILVALAVLLAIAGALLVGGFLGGPPSRPVAAAVHRAQPGHLPAKARLDASAGPLGDDGEAAAAIAPADTPAEASAPGRRSARLAAARPLDVRGVVVDEAGRPVADARVVAETLHEEGEGAPARWRALEGVAANTAGDGSFRLTGVLDADRVGLRAWHRNHSVGLRVECAPDARDVVIVLEAAGSVAGRLYLDRGISADLFRITARGTQEVGSDYEGELDAQGEYEIPGLPEGTYQVLVALEHEPETALRFDDVMVATGSVTWLPESDLRGRVTTFDLHIRDASGEPPANAFVRRRAAGAAEFGALAQPVNFGEASIATLEPCLDLRVEAPRHRPALLACVSSESSAVLVPGTEIRLVLEDSIGGLQTSIQVGALLERRGAGSSSFGRMCRFDADGVALTTVEEPGTYDVRVYVWKQEGAGVGALLSNRVESTLELDAGFTQRSFAIRLSKGTIEHVRSAGTDRD